MVATEARVVIPKLSPEVRVTNAQRKLAVYSTLLNNEAMSPGTIALSEQTRNKYQRNEGRLGKVLGMTNPLSLRENALRQGMRWYETYIPAPQLSEELTMAKKS